MYCRFPMLMINKRILRILTLLLITSCLTICIYLISFNSNTSLTPILSNFNDHDHILISIGFTTCKSYAFFQYCHDNNNFNNIYNLITQISNDHQLINSIKITHSKKDLYALNTFITTTHPYQITLPLNLIKKYNIPTIQDFFIYNTNDDGNSNNNNKIPSQILKETGNTTRNIKQLQSQGYFNPGFGVWYKISTSNKSQYSNVNFLFNSKLKHPSPDWDVVSPYPINLYKNDHKSMGMHRDYSDFKTFDYHQFDYEVYLYVKKKNTSPLPTTNLKLDNSGKFKIIQLADLHLSTGFGKCLDMYPELDYPIQNCLADTLTLQFVEQVLDLENPDLVVFTGDQLYGSASFDSESTIYKMIYPLIKRRIPYAMVFGNHDDENASLNRSKLMNLLQSLPYSLSKYGPSNIDGVGNYEILVGNLENPDLVIYMLDSHTSLPDRRGYDWFKESQKNYITELSSKHENVLSLSFFHIPLFEYRNINGKPSNEFTGSFREAIMSSNVNSGMFNILQDANVKLVSVGHDHVNDFCFQNDNINLCYGGAGGFAGYGGYGGYKRRIRIFEVNVAENSIKTWKRVFDDVENIIDLQDLPI